MNKNKVKVKVMDLKKIFNKKIPFVFLIIISVLLIFSPLKNIYAVKDLDTIEVVIIPENPKPKQKVEVKLNSYSFDINAAEVSIFINNESFKKGVGIKSFNFLSGKLGQKTTLKVVVKKINGSQVVFEKDIVPTETSLIYELNNPHTPFGYAGKSTMMSNSALTIFAFPNFINKNGQKISKDSLVYTWYKNNNIDSSKSGFGKSKYSIKRLDAFPRETVISVKVKTLDEELSSDSQLIFKPKRSKVEFYLLDPVLPFSFKNIANPSINSSFLDTEILAIPYFMDDIGNDGVEYQWIIGGKKYTHPEDKDKNKILLINNFEDSGFIDNINISLQIKNKFRILQSLKKSFKVNFSEMYSENNQDEFFNTGKIKEPSGFFGF